MNARRLFAVLFTIVIIVAVGTQIAVMHFDHPMTLTVMCLAAMVFGRSVGKSFRSWVREEEDR